jgi:hypothetical protein
VDLLQVVCQLLHDSKGNSALSAAAAAAAAGGSSRSTPPLKGLLAAVQELLLLKAQGQELVQHQSSAIGNPANNPNCQLSTVSCQLSIYPPSSWLKP